MRAWVEGITQRIMELKPRRVLEVGCGTGLLLFPIAPHCEMYWGTDYSTAVIAKLQTNVQRVGGLGHVHLEQRFAHDFTGWHVGQFDCVIINSVSQYFPDVEYLRQVLLGLSQCIAPGGVLFVGDVRNYRLLELFHQSVTRFRQPELMPAQLDQQARQAMLREAELTVDPRFFMAFASEQPAVESIGIEPERSRFRNEMSQFRYHAILRFAAAPGAVADSLAITWQDWQLHPMSASGLARHLAAQRPAGFGLRHVSNARITELQPGAQAGIDPDEWWELGQALGYQILVSWATGYSDGAYDVCAVRQDYKDAMRAGQQALAVLARETAGVNHTIWHKYTNTPLRDTGVPPEFIAQLRDYLRQRLPDFMVPAALVVLPVLPRTPGGKLDRNALPAPEIQTRVDGAQPRQPAEELLAGIWCEVLGLPEVGLEDNFFALGGDSILSIQVVSRARQAGLRLTPQLLLQHQTIASLARASLRQADIRAEQTPVIGMAPLTPIQRWFFAQELAHPHHFNQALLLSVPPELDETALRTALQTLCNHHDALRLRYHRSDKSGVWSQTFAPLLAETQAGTPPWDALLTVYNTPPFPAAIALTEVQQVMATVQASCDLGQGPLLRALWLRAASGEGRLLLVIHHLAVDGVSWPILLEDLATAYRQYQYSQPIQLPTKTSSYQQWAGQLADLAEALTSELAWWTPPVHYQHLPADGELAGQALAGTLDNRMGNSQTLHIQLDAERSRILTQDGPAKTQANMDVLLLAALCRAVREWLADAGQDVDGGGPLLLDMESHGREDLLEDTDVSRTVGWFTALYPVCLDLTGQASMLAWVQAVHAQLARVPNHGVGYGLLRYLHPDPSVRRCLEVWPQARLGFNYLGQFDATFRRAGVFQWANESPGPLWAADNQRYHWLDINGWMINSQLEFSWTYHPGLNAAASIQRLADGFQRALAELADSLRTLTPWPHGVFHLPPADLQTVMQAMTAADEAFYPLTPTQADMLAHRLQVLDSGLYFTQFQLRLQGALDEALFRQAWQQTASNQPVLRTRFLWQGMETPLQIVGAPQPLCWQSHDFINLSPEDSDLAWQQLLAAERRQGFDPAVAPLCRYVLVRESADVWRFLWNVPHVLMDGWSSPVVLQQVFSSYYAMLQQSQAATVLPAPAFVEFLAWRQKLRDNAGKTMLFWRRELQDWPGPAQFPTNAFAPTALTRYVDSVLHLPPEDTAVLQSLIRKQAITASTLLQAAWAVLLARHSGQNDIVFGVTVAGRPAELPHVEQRVGMYINTVPVRVKIQPELALKDWLQHLQAAQIERQPHEWAGLAEIQTWLDPEHGRNPEHGRSMAQPLFTTHFRYQNYPLDRGALAANLPDLRITSVEWVDWWHYPLNLMIVPGESLQIWLSHDTQHYATATVETWLAEYAQLLRAVKTGGETRTVGEWLAAT